MPISLNSELLKSMAVDVVRKFASGSPLEDAIAGMALQKGLSAEQTQRLIEAANQIAYLNYLSSTQDRTGEIPVATPQGVFAKMTTPEIEKSASVSSRVPEVDMNDPFLELVEKQASTVVTPDFSDIKMTDGALVQHYLIGTAQAERELTKLAYEISDCKKSIQSLVRDVQGDKYALIKAAQLGDRISPLTHEFLEKIASEQQVFEKQSGIRVKETETFARDIQRLDQALVTSQKALVKKAAVEETLNKATANKSSFLGRTFDKMLPKVDPNKVPVLPKVVGKASKIALKVPLNPAFVHAQIGSTIPHNRDVWKVLQGGTTYN